MKKIKCLVFVLLIIFTFSLSSQTVSEPKEQKTQDTLCAFAEDFFLILNKNNPDIGQFVKELRPFTFNTNPEVQRIALSLIEGLELEGCDPEEAKGEAVHDLGRLIKCSVKAVTNPTLDQTQLRKSDLLTGISTMETVLAETLPKENVNYHRLMIESLAEKRSDMALYAYLKIAEDRCFE